ncbi:MAG TPA: ABC transporter ATP-binding protein [Alphaproteobacteria bacterium]|nr:ABC transporter ATP-binding protein [Alphaproteobacteria bacterium]
MLEVRDAHVFYGDLHVLHGVSVQIASGELVGLVGANGHGKSTLLKAICGLIPIRSGEVIYEGLRINELDAPERVAKGIVYVAEERHLFPDMSVRENLMLGAYLPSARKRRHEHLQLVFDLYPRLEERQHQLARTLSGGEAQMLALGRGIMSAARFMAIDEPSFGLAPNLVRAMFDTIERINEAGMAILIVEQNLLQLENYATRVYKLEEGRIVDGSAFQAAMQ